MSGILKNSGTLHLQFARCASRKVNMANDVHLSGRRVMKKIQMGKARPAIFHQFDTLVELSDGSVIRRSSQSPKDEIRMITDQRNSVLWNPFRSDLVTVDPNATGKVNKFKKRFVDFQDTPAGDSGAESSVNDNLVEMLGVNVQEVLKGGKLLDKKRSKK